MQIAARTAAWAKSDGWVNPYQTADNALVAMWDGFRNGNNPMTLQSLISDGWVDCVNGIVGRRKNGNSLELDGNSIVFDLQTNGYIEIANSSEIFDDCFNNQGGRGMTIQVCSKENSYESLYGYCTTSGEMYALSAHQSRNAGFLVIHDGNKYWYGSGSNKGNLPGTHTITYGDSVGTTPGESGFYFRTWINLIRSSTYLIGSSFEDIDNGVFVISKRRSDNYSVSCKINCIRVYNRDLTNDEITANYSIDKARFGLT